MPVSLQTWNQRLLHSTASATTWKVALKALVAYLATTPTPGWHIEVVTDGTDHTTSSQDTPYVELAFSTPLGDDATEFHILLAAQDGTSALNNANIYNNGSAHQFHQNKAAGQLYIGYARAGRSGALADPFGATNPYGSDPFTGFFRLSETAAISHWFIHDAAEMLALGMVMSNGHIRGVTIGAIAIPSVPTATPRSDGRMTGMFSWGRNDETMSTAFRSGLQSSLLSRNRSAASTHHDHQAFGVVDDLEGLIEIAAGSWSPGTSTTANTDGEFTDLFGNMAKSPIRLIKLNAAGTVHLDPGRWVGHLRQVRNCENAVCRQILLNPDNSHNGYALSSGNTNAEPALLLSNS